MTIPATHSLVDACDRVWDVAIVGAGPAGAMAAHQLAQRGRDVLLIDKAEFPRAKVCGCCLNRASQHALQQAGLGDLVKRLGAEPINRFHVAAGSRAARLPLNGTVSLSRRAFDTELVRAAVDSGAAFLPLTEARLLAPNEDTRQLNLRSKDGQQQTVRSKVLLAADGVGSSLMRGGKEVDSTTRADSRIGAGTVVDMEMDAYEAGTIFMACGTDGYVGLVRLEDGRLDIAAALDRRPVKQVGGIGALASTIISEAGFPEVPGLAEEDWQGTPLLTRRAHRVASERAFLIGDAAGYVEPFTGEGIAWALAGGLAVAPLADRAADQWHASLADEWTTQYSRIVKRRQFLCKLLSRGLRYPRITRLSVNVVSRFPIFAKPFTRALTSPSELAVPR